MPHCHCDLDQYWVGLVSAGSSSHSSLISKPLSVLVLVNDDALDWLYLVNIKTVGIFERHSSAYCAGWVLGQENLGLWIRDGRCGGLAPSELVSVSQLWSGAQDLHHGTHNYCLRAGGRKGPRGLQSFPCTDGDCWTIRKSLLMTTEVSIIGGVPFPRDRCHLLKIHFFKSLNEDMKIQLLE